MSRRRRAEKREIEPDPIYGSTVLARFINKLMVSGKKSIARKIVYTALEDFAKKTAQESPLDAFEQALENVKPSVEVKTRRVGGSNYQVPVEVPARRREALAMDWIIRFSRSKPGRSMVSALTMELSDCFNGQGASVKKRDETHRMAEANKAFAHYNKR